MKNKKKALVCVAHPDDETIFFGGLILNRHYDWTAICVTDANADGKGTQRIAQFQKACQKLKIKKAICLQYPDIFEQRIETPQLVQDLQKLGKFQKVFTHGPLGEYGHIHHQDVSWAVHQVFTDQAEVISPAYNLYPEIKISLSKKDFQIKTQILRQIYEDESMRFLGFLPATSAEGYIRLSKQEVDAIYLHITKQKKLDPKKLRHYRWLTAYIENRQYELKTRVF